MLLFGLSEEVLRCHGMARIEDKPSAAGRAPFRTHATKPAASSSNDPREELFMQPRIDYTKYAKEALKSMFGLEKYISESGLDHKLIHLIKMRASQINGCAYCIDMHSKDARASARPSRGCTNSMPGARHLFTRTVNVPRSNGPRRSHQSRKRMSRMPFTTKSKNTSARRRSSI